jgi:hypothetical protein
VALVEKHFVLQFARGVDSILHRKTNPLLTELQSRKAENVPGAHRAPQSLNARMGSTFPVLLLGAADAEHQVVARVAYKLARPFATHAAHILPQLSFLLQDENFGGCDFLLVGENKSVRGPPHGEILHCPDTLQSGKGVKVLQFEEDVKTALQQFEKEVGAGDPFEERRKEHAE